MSPERKPRPSARADILRVFASLVAEKGYNEASIANVADPLGLSKGTVAFHFGSKEAMLRSLIDSYMHRRLEEAFHILSRLSTPPDQLCGMVYALLAVNRDDRDSAHTFRREFIRFKNAGGDTGLRELRGSYFAIVHGILRRGIETGDFRSQDSRIVTMQIFGMCNYAWTWLNLDGERSIEEIAAIFCDTIIGGLRTADAGHLESLELEETMTRAVAAVLSAPNRTL